jgi:hypothetical protein
MGMRQIDDTGSSAKLNLVDEAATTRTHEPASKLRRYGHHPNVGSWTVGLVVVSMQTVLTLLSCQRDRSPCRDNRRKRWTPPLAPRIEGATATVSIGHRENQQKSLNSAQNHCAMFTTLGGSS